MPGLLHMKPLPHGTRVAFVGGFSCLVFVFWGLLVLKTSRMVNCMMLESLAGYAGKLQAGVWFQEGRYRLLELSADSQTVFTGGKNGQFEVWTWAHHENWLVAGDADGAFVEAFNQRMKQLANEKKK